jgi:peptidyl-prolyl cis-trans isomerase A (cyclophilin A)
MNIKSGGVKMSGAKRLVPAICLFCITMIMTAPALNSSADPVVVLDTSMGSIKVRLFAEKAPLTVRNFLDYVNSGFYEGTIVHRIDFVIGLGGYTGSLSEKPARPPVKNESKNGLKNLRGTLAMARYDDPHSATSQFFINLKDNGHLDPSGNAYGYTVFGEVVEGMDVVEKIAEVKTGTVGSFRNFPLQVIAIRSAKVIS